MPMSANAFAKARFEQARKNAAKAAKNAARANRQAAAANAAAANALLKLKTAGR